MTQKIKFQIKRCTSSTRTSYTPAESELLHETDTDTIYIGDGSTAGGILPSSSASGEINTASNIGTSGVGVFKQKTGSNLELKKIDSVSNKLSVTDNTADNKIDVEINEANFTELINKNIVDAKGDMLIGTADNTVEVLPIAANGQVMVSDSSETTGVRWSPIFANRYKATYITTAAATIDINNDQAIVVAYEFGTCKLTFPNSNTFANDGYGHEFMIYNATGNTVEIEFSDGQTLWNGIGQIRLTKHGDMARIGATYPNVGDGWFMLAPIEICTQVNRDLDWAGGNFIHDAAVPFTTSPLEENPEIVEHDAINTSRVYFKTAGRHHINYWFQVDSTGGSSWHIKSWLLINGVTVLNGSTAKTANYQNEDAHICLGTLHYDSQAGDYIELMANHYNLTGAIAKVVMTINSKV